MKISIALCTYNGAKHLPDQLESIVKQTRLPDELVVCDDNSSDQTMQILRDFIKQAPFPVLLEQNTVNLGSTLNFEKAISKCSGDIIALCDQDDYWLPQKLAMIEATMSKHPNAGLVFSDAEIADENLHSLNKTMWQHIRFGPEIQRSIQTDQAFILLLKRNYVTGATMAFRAKYREAVLPISPHWVHDAWLTINIAAQTSLKLIEQPLIKYRQHTTNQIGAADKRKRLLPYFRHLIREQSKTYEREYQAYIDLYDHLSKQTNLEYPSDYSLNLATKVEHWRIRSALETPPIPRLKQILNELYLRRYQRYAVHGTWAALRDLLYLAIGMLVHNHQHD